MDQIRRGFEAITPPRLGVQTELILSARQRREAQTGGGDIRHRRHGDEHEGGKGVGGAIIREEGELIKAEIIRRGAVRDIGRCAGELPE